MQKKQNRPQQKSMKPKAGYLRRYIKLRNHQPDSSRNKGTKIKSTKLDENGEITTDNTEIQRILRDYYQQLHANKMDNLEKMDKFLEKYNFPKLDQGRNRKSIKLEMEMERSQQTTQKYKGS